MVYRIKNWEKFQHYQSGPKKGKVSWIKIYRSLLDDPDWFALDDQASRLLVNLWLLASEGLDGTLPPVRKIAFRLRMTEKAVNEGLSKLTHFVASERLADGYPMASTEVEVEVEVEVEKEKKGKRRFAPPSVEEVLKYCMDRKNRVSPESFIDFYESVGWKVGNKPMKDWQAAVRTWEKREDRGPVNGVSGVTYERQCEFVGGPRNERCLAKGRNKVGHQWMCSAHSPIR